MRLLSNSSTHDGFLAPVVITPASNTKKDTILACFLFANRLDCEALTKAFVESEDIQVVSATTDYLMCFEACRRSNPQVLVIDSAVCEGAVALAHEAIRSRLIHAVVILDKQVRESIVSQILPNPLISYLTRNASIKTLIEVMIAIGRGQHRYLDPAISHRVVKSKKGFTLLPEESHKTFALLSKRELQVAKLLASGLSSREVAAELQITNSTADNHRARLMAKLSLRKATELTLLAVREGLIQC